jgi:NAD(P)-dependent dehydrogenase (short-subunit alcohol dehydrogenase family)
MKKPQKKWALVTGAAKRMGKVLSTRLAEKGYSLILHYHHSRTEAVNFARELERKGASVELIRANLENEKDVLALCQKVLKKGSPDLLVNNASVYYPTPLKTLKLNDWNRVLKTNLTAPFILSLQLGRRMKPGARIIHIADTAGFRPYRNYLPYCVSKGALLSLTRALALELAPRVMVNSVSPGPIVPPPWESQKVIQNVAKKIPLQRWGGFDEIAKAVLFLCESNFATGINLIVDGGYQLI